MMNNESMYFSVIDAAVDKIRLAMLSGSPIVYVKTDSDVTIRRIVSRKENPLVVLRCGDNAGQMRGRPLHQVINRCHNFKAERSHQMIVFGCDRHQLFRFKCFAVHHHCFHNFCKRFSLFAV